MEKSDELSVPFCLTWFDPEGVHGGVGSAAADDAASSFSGKEEEVLTCIAICNKWNQVEIMEKKFSEE